jgi:hypothetical protein
MGGASTQISFEIPADYPVADPRESVYDGVEEMLQTKLPQYFKRCKSSSYSHNDLGTIATMAVIAVGDPWCTSGTGM